MKNLIQLIKNKVQEIKQQRALRNQAVGPKNLRAVRRSDKARWIKTDQLLDDWNERTALLAAMIKPESKVIEFGAGNMILKSLLPQSCSYTASDIVERNSETLVCDLNDKITFDLHSYDTAVFSGVIEYVYNFEDVLKQFPENLKNVVLSYSCTDISTVDRLKNGWLSDYSRKELKRIFQRCNYEITDYKEWRNQSLFCLEKRG